MRGFSIALAVLLAGCGGGGFSSATSDAGQDASPEAGQDAGEDAPSADVVQPDAEVKPDAGAGVVTPEAGEDATEEVSTPEAGEDVVTGPCPTGRGPAMVQTIAGFCIDSTEVTRSQYGDFLADNPSLVGQPVECSWNTTYTPPQECMARPQTCQDGCANFPQQCVDWCDAVAFCEWAGKRLCGKIGGGQVGELDAVEGEWLNVCSSGGVNDYPYGPTYEQGACNAYPVNCENGECHPSEVSSLAQCETMGVFDLVGNVAEWVNGCNDEQCSLRGAMFGETQVPSCFWVGTSPRNQQDSMIGFRCCADAN